MMGLDMYLNRISKTPKNEKEKVLAVLTGDDKNKEVAYWRKANAIHNWFVNNVQNGNDDCNEYLVTKEKIEELISVIKNVLKDELSAIAEITADNLLPTKSGFFFGGTSYDDDYYGDLRDTIKMLNEVLKTTDFETQEIYYSSSW